MFMEKKSIINTNITQTQNARSLRACARARVDNPGKRRAAANVARHGEVSEKVIERYLCRRVKELGGLCLKYSNPGESGYPDRVVVMPGGSVAWVELKSRGKRPTAIQLTRLDELRRLGHSVFVADSKDLVDDLLINMGML